MKVNVSAKVEHLTFQSKMSVKNENVCYWILFFSYLKRKKKCSSKSSWILHCHQKWISMHFLSKMLWFQLKTWKRTFPSGLPSGRTFLFSQGKGAPTSIWAVMCTKLVDGKCLVQFLVALFDLAIRSFP